MASPEHHGSGPATYLLIAVILGVVTFIEFGLIQFPQAWLSSIAVGITLITLSVGKFVLVVAYFMHLKDDQNTYSGFFSTGMVFALGTFVVLAILFTVPSVVNTLRESIKAQTDANAGHGEELHGLPEELLASIESGGYSREMNVILDIPRPKDQTVALIPPAVDASPAFALLETPPLFASAGQSGTTPIDDDGGDPSAQATPGFDAERGAEVFGGSCSDCHQADGQGIPAAFPPLAGNLPTIFNAGGRSYLINAVLYGLQGEISVLGQSYNGVMPGWSQLSDEDIAAVLNHELTSWDNAELLEDSVPIEAAEVADRRDAGLSPNDILGLRSALDLP